MQVHSLSHTHTLCESQTHSRTHSQVDFTLARMSVGFRAALDYGQGLVSSCVCVSACLCLCLPWCAPACLCWCVPVYVRIHTYTHIRTHTLVHTQTYPYKEDKDGRGERKDETYYAAAAARGVGAGREVDAGVRSYWEGELISLGAGSGRGGREEGGLGGAGGKVSLKLAVQPRQLKAAQARCATGDV